MNEKEIVLEDWSIVAFLSLPEIQQKYNLEIIPFKQNNGRVAFRVHGDVNSAIADIYANKKVSINDFMRTLKSVRHTIFTLRSLNINKTENDEEKE